MRLLAGTDLVCGPGAPDVLDFALLKHFQSSLKSVKIGWDKSRGSCNATSVQELLVIITGVVGVDVHGGRCGVPSNSFSSPILEPPLSPC